MSEQNKNCHVLLVEDNIDVRESTLLLLEMAGYQATGVDNGQDALYELCRMQELPCLILLDLMMPVMDGWEFCQELQRNAVFAQIPVIVISAIDGDCAAFDNAIVRLRKPILVNQLVSAITQACSGKPCTRLGPRSKMDSAPLPGITAQAFENSSDGKALPRQWVVPRSLGPDSEVIAIVQAAKGTRQYGTHRPGYPFVQAHDQLDPRVSWQIPGQALYLLPSRCDTVEQDGDSKPIRASPADASFFVHVATSSGSVSSTVRIKRYMSWSCNRFPRQTPILRRPMAMPMQKVVDPPSWGHGDVALLMRTRDWTASPLGAPETWPQSLRSTVGLMLNSALPMFVAWGPELGLIYNDGYAEILGHKHPSALGQRFETTWPEIWDDISPIVAQAMAGERTYFENVPFTLHRKGYPEQTWFTFSYSPVHDEAGAVAGLFCICTETTQKVLAERHRLDENERLRQLFQQAPGLMAVVRGPKHTFELVNEAYQQLIGHRDVVGLTVEEALPELEGQGFFELLDSVYSNGEPFVGRAVPIKLERQRGIDLEERFVDFVYQPILNATGEVVGIFAQGNDVTDAVRATQALRESEKRLRQLANTIPHLAWIAEPDGYIYWYNDRWYEYTGTTQEEMQGSGWQKVHHPQNLPGVLEKWHRCLLLGESFEMPFPLRSASGEYRMFFTRVAPLRDESGKIVQWFGTNTDIHDIEKAQEELRSASRRKDEFLAMLAHELRNPLAPINTAAQILKLSILDPERVRKTSAVISRQVAHMTELVDDLLDVSRVTRGLVSLQKEPVDIADVLADAVEQAIPLIEQKKQQLTVQLSDEAIFVDGDKTRLTQIFSNILNNAAKYTPEQGHIAVHLDSSADEVEICIQDDGVGIDEKLLPYVFELFTQGERSSDRSQGGLGLGLALVKSLVELHGGTVAADSQGANTGCKFVVKLPRLTGLAAAESTDKSTAKDSAAPHALSVLVVDDNVDAAQTLAMMLELEGYEVRTEYTATAALKRVAEQAPQVMILDIGLPDMDGYELARRIRARPEANQSTLIALSGYGPSSETHPSSPPVFSHHLVKPVNTQTLLDVLAAVD